MTDIPEEIVERVARELINQEWAISNAPGNASKNAEADWSIPTIREYYCNQARTALKECGWAEMREALGKSAEYIVRDQNGQPRNPGYVLGEIAVALSAVRKP